MRLFSMLILAVLAIVAIVVSRPVSAQAVSATTVDVSDRLSVASSNVQIAGAHRFFSALLVIQNVSGTIKHSWQITGTGGQYATQLTSASGTATTTPYVDSVTGFANGGGIESAAQSIFDFDTTNAQDASSASIAFPAFNSTGTALVVNATTRTINVNGSAITRTVLVFSNAATGALFSLNTTNIPSSTLISTRVWGFLN